MSTMNHQRGLTTVGILMVLAMLLLVGIVIILVFGYAHQMDLKTHRSRVANWYHIELPESSDNRYPENELAAIRSSICATLSEYLAKSERAAEELTALESLIAPTNPSDAQERLKHIIKAQAVRRDAFWQFGEAHHVAELIPNLLPEEGCLP